MIVGSLIIFVSGYRFLINQATYHLKISNFIQTYHYKAPESSKLVSSEDFFYHPILSSLKRLSCEALVIYSGMFWPAPDNNFDGCNLETNP
jgi:hypothetical protein